MRKRVYYVRPLRPGFRGNYPVGGLVYCFKGTRLEVRHHRSTVFSDGASHLVGYTERTTTVLSFFQTEWDTGVDAFLRS